MRSPHDDTKTTVCVRVLSAVRNEGKQVEPECRLRRSESVRMRMPGRRSTFNIKRVLSPFFAASGEVFVFFLPSSVAMSLAESATGDHEEAQRQEASEQAVRSGTLPEQNGTSAPTLRIFSQDLKNLKKDLLKALKDSRPAQEHTNALTLLRDDLTQLKEDVSAVFMTTDRRDDEDTAMLQEATLPSVADSQQTPHTARRRGLCTGGRQEHQEGREEEEEEAAAADILSFRTDVKKDDVGKEMGGAKDTSWSSPVACYLTLDPDTANSELRLSEGNRKSSRAWSSLRGGQNPQRFLSCPQVLCRQGLLGAAYWEVLWGGGADVGVAYGDIARDGNVADCLLGLNRRSWSLECSERAYAANHDNRTVARRMPRPFTHRVGVHLDWAAGSLSFYCVSRDAMTLIHTFHATFTEPLYPAFWLWAYNASVTLCSLTRGWESRLGISCSR
ncbi:uncharacterized protein LOC144026816 isoform X2 [Festucalex cinctus]